MPISVNNNLINGFGVNTLSTDFMTPRTPSANGIQVNKGILTLKASKYELSSTRAKNIVVKRQTSFVFKNCVTMDWSSLYSSMPVEQNAGMTCYYDENTYIKFGIFTECQNDIINYKLKVFEKIDAIERTCFEIDLTTQLKEALSENNTEIELQVDTSYLTRNFLYRIKNNSEQTAWISLGSLDNVYYLCDEGISKGKRFTGAMIGVYAFSPIDDLSVKFYDFY